MHTHAPLGGGVPLWSLDQTSRDPAEPALNPTELHPPGASSWCVWDSTRLNTVLLERLNKTLIIPTATFWLEQTL